MARREEVAEARIPTDLAPAYNFLAGGGAMGALMRSMDWSHTPLGSPQTWPASLCTSVSTCLNCAFPILIWWGPQLVMLYNDEYRPILGSQKHPGAMGRPGAEVWPEIWSVIGPMLRQVTEEREPARARDLLLLMDRYGYIEETYFSFSYSPIIDEKGDVGGVFCPVIETTQKVIGERRLRTLRDLAALNHAREQPQEVCTDVAGVLAQANCDIPFVLIYLSENGVARLCATGGIQKGECGAPELIDLSTDDSDCWPLASAASSRAPYLVTDLAGRFATLPSGAWADPPRQALITPIVLPGHTDEIAFLIAAVSPRRELDPDYSTFYRLIADQMTSAMADVQAFDEERRRAAALAQIDRAKTVFFSNISHEFRTPLTLLLGPLDQALSVSPEQLPAQRAELEVAHRNGKRLLQLVNTLLDFARIEAGRVQAVYEPVELASFTAELASVFRSAAERAGVHLLVECSKPVANAYVDRDMWEKIVLNLISNALKYTLDGEIRVSVRSSDDHVELVVADTGIGIASTELPHLFERFYRVPGARGRTHEGSGIGLSLASELVKLHGGEIHVESEPNAGSAFTVRLPLGFAHLPKERINHERAQTPAGGRTQSYVEDQSCVEEVMRWMPQVTTDTAAHRTLSTLPDQYASDLSSSTTAAATVLVVDDNADMREYLRRLLSQRFNVIGANDGAEALSIIEQAGVDLILADVMMPRVDGFELLKTLRAKPRTRHLPVILLSARAGEEARIAGLDAGADDYLVKPFSARELLARVNAQITVAHLRQQTHEAQRAAETANRQATEERNRRLQAQHEQLRELFEKAPGFMAVLRGADHVFELANPAFYTVVGHREIIGQPILQALPEIIDQPFPVLLDRVFVTGEAYAGKAVKILLQRTPGAMSEERYVDFVYQPLKDNDGNVSGVFVEGYDVTERIEAENSLQDVNRRKDEFLATLAHELRNPLAALAAASQLLAKAPEKPDVAAMAREALHRQVDHMARLLDDLLEVSRITHGMMQLRTERLKLTDAITAAVESAQPLIDSKRHQLTLQLPEQPIYVDADRVRLTQIFANLLTNAAKYTDPGGHINVQARVDSGEVQVSVRDNGIGIAPEMLLRVFEMFSQAKPALQRSQGGLGIGLSLVRGLVELHGGTVEARSEGARMGSEFIVRLPLAAVQQDPAPVSSSLAPSDASGNALRILIADDNIDSANSWAVLLEITGHEVRTASNGREALEIAEEFRPQFALLDIGMPEMNGYEVARRIRRTDWGNHVVLTAVTGWGHEHDKQQARNAGFDHHLTKPVELAAVEPLLTQAMQAATMTER